MSRLVSKCVCKRKTFAEIKIQLHELSISTLEEMLSNNLAGTGCGMCKPYLNKMIFTGEVEFKPGDFHIDPISNEK